MFMKADTLLCMLTEFTLLVGVGNMRVASSNLKTTLNKNNFSQNVKPLVPKKINRRIFFHLHSLR